MADRGRKPRSRASRVLKDGEKQDVVLRTEPLVPPDKLSDRQQEFWDVYVEPFKWIQQSDAFTAYVLVNLMEEYVADPKGTPIAKIVELRRTMCDLQILSSEQTRAGLDLKREDSPGRFFSD